MSRASALLVCLPLVAWGEQLGLLGTVPPPQGTALSAPGHLEDQAFSQPFSEWQSSPTLPPEIAAPLPVSAVTSAPASPSQPPWGTGFSVGGPAEEASASRPPWGTGFSLGGAAEEALVPGDMVKEVKTGRIGTLMIDNGSGERPYQVVFQQGGPSYFLKRGDVVKVTNPEAELEKVNDTEKCEHGHWDPIQEVCECYDGWKHSGITDASNFVKGVCKQFQCKSDQHCQKELQQSGIADATCPIKGWNCYCGWSHVSFETVAGEKGGAECMGPMYTLVTWMSESTYWLLSWLFMPIGALAVLLLPFGRTRTVCDHHWPSLLNSTRKFFGREPTCYGRCLTTQGYTMSNFKDDIAWTLYIVEIGVWVYVFLITTYFMAITTWTLVLWVAVLLALFLACLAAVCGALLSCCGAAACGGDMSGAGGGASTFAADGGAALGGADCCCCCEAGCCEAGGSCCSELAIACSGPETCCGDFCCGCVDAMCCNYGYGPPPLYGYYGAPDPFFWSTANLGGSSDCRCDCFEKCSCCRPLANLLFVFPVMPENALGGLFGLLILGTHSHTPPGCLYRGGNPFVEFLRMRGWRQYRDMHGDHAWRRQVYQFLNGGEGVDAVPRVNSHRMQVRGDPRGERIGRSFVVHVNRPFSRKDRCVPSSFEDYAKNECWCCQDSCPEWHHWESCGHMLCKRCSTQVLARQMPCPLCRRTSLRIVEGRAIDGGGEADECTATTSESDEEGRPLSQFRCQRAGL